MGVHVNSVSGQGHAKIWHAEGVAGTIETQEAKRIVIAVSAADTD